VQLLPDVTYSLVLTAQPPALTYLGADKNGAQNGANDLNPVAKNTFISQTASQLYAAFLPNRGGTYEVTLYGNDGCNSNSYDSVSVTTQCLGINAPTASPSVTPTALNPVAVISINGSYSTLGPGGNMNNMLNYAIRLTSRPQLLMGDVGQYTAAGAAYDAASFGCMLGKNWAVGGTPGVLGAQTFQTVTTTLGVEGSYTFAVTALDACSRSADTTFTLTAPTCASPNTVKGFYTGNSQTVTWSNHKFAVPTLAPTVAGGAPSGSTFSWFMTGAPAGVQTNIYPSVSPAALASSIKCAAYTTSSWNVGFTTDSIRSVSSADLYAPLQTSTSSSFSTYTLSQTAVGAHTLSMQTLGACNADTTSFTVTTTCNQAAQFICNGNTTCVDNTVSVYSNPNGPSQTLSHWSCANGYYSPVFINNLGTAGFDTASNSDDLTFTVTLSVNPNSGRLSWWNSAYYTQSVSWDILVADTNTDVLDDMGNFAAITTALTTSVQSALSASSLFGSDSARFILSNTALATAVGTYANTVTAPKLGVSVAAGCYVIGYGRKFTVTATYAILPPLHFRSFGVVLNVNSGDRNARGYARTLTGIDARPLSQFDADFRAALPALLTTASALSAYTGSKAITTSNAPSTLVAVPNTFIFKTTVAGAGLANTFLTTSFVPDVDGTYSSAGSVVDDCPGSSAATWSKTTTVSAPTCGSLPGLSVTQYDSNGVAGAVTRAWSNSTIKFGNAWSYRAVGPAYTLAAASTLTSVFTACFVANGAACTTSNVPSGTPSGTISFPSSNANQVVMIAFTLPSTVNGATVQFQYNPSNSNPVAGGELHVGCTQHPTSYAATTAVTYFYTIDSTLASSGVASFVLPDACLSSNTMDLVLAVFPTSATTVPAWQLSGFQVYSHASGYNAIGAPCVATVALTSSIGNYPVHGNFTTANLAASALSTTQFASNDGYSTNLPSNSVSYTLSYSASVSFPKWVISAGVCSGTSSPSQTTQLSCPTYTPGFTAPSTVKYNLTNLHFNPASLQWGNIQNWAWQKLEDFSFQYQVLTAPPSSVLNAMNLASNILGKQMQNKYGKWYTGLDANGNVVMVPWTVSCDSKSATLSKPTNLTTVTESVTSVINTTYGAAIDVNSIKVWLKPFAPNTSPAQLPWMDVTTSPKNGNYWNYYLWALGQVDFIPDVDGMYTISSTLNDMCNPLFNQSAVVNTQSCQSLGFTVAVSQLSTSTPSITDSGAGRVMLQGTVNGVSKFTEDVHTLKLTWMVQPVNPPSWFTGPVKIVDADTLYASFIPPYAGNFNVTLGVSVGTGCAAVSNSININVACGVNGVPAPSVVVAQAAQTSGVGSNNFKRIGQNGQLTIPYLPNVGLNQDNIYWIGVATCPVMASWWSLPSTVSYTCPSTTYSVKVVSVWPSQLLPSARKQAVVVTVNVGNPGATTGFIPAGLMDSLYMQSDIDGSAMSINIAGVACTNPYVTDATSGKIVCLFDGPSVQAGPQRVTATLLGVASADSGGDLYVPFSLAPVLTGVSGSPNLPTTGGTVIISGVNLAFPSWSNPNIGVSNWSPADTIVTVAGRPCTGVSLVGSLTTGSNPQISCKYAAGYGVMLPVTVQLGFRDISGSLSMSSVAQGFIFSYDVPVVMSLTSPSNVGTGGYIATAVIKNLGPRYNTPNYMPPVPNMAATNKTVWPYSDLALTLGNKPITWFSVVSDDAGSGATVNFRVPPGCGVNLDLTVLRANALSVPGAGQQFSYGAPVISCISQEYLLVNASACWRVTIDGYNFGSISGANAVNVSFWQPNGAFRGACDDIEYQGNQTQYVRFSCRRPVNAVPGDTVLVTNECGQTSPNSAVYVMSTTPTNSPTSSNTPTPTTSITPTISVTPTVTPTRGSESITPTISVTPTISWSVTRTSSVTPISQSATPTISVTPSTSNTATASLSFGASPSSTRTVTPTPSVTPSPSPSPCPFGGPLQQTCGGQGVCSSGTCLCNLGYQGIACTQVSVNDPCAGACPYSQCVGQNAAGQAVCVCPAGQSGDPYLSNGCATDWTFISVGPWGECSAKCGSDGIAKRELTCYNSQLFKPVDWSQCAALTPMPANTTACNRFACDVQDVSVQVSASILFDFASFKGDNDLISIFVKAFMIEIGNVLNINQNRLFFVALNATTRYVNFTILPASTTLSSHGNFRLLTVNQNSSSTDLATALQSIVNNQTYLSTSHTTWLRRVDPSTFSTQTIHPPVKPKSSDDNTGAIVGGVVGGIGGAAVVGFLLYRYREKVPGLKNLGKEKKPAPRVSKNPLFEAVDGAKSPAAGGRTGAGTGVSTPAAAGAATPSRPGAITVGDDEATDGVSTGSPDTRAKRASIELTTARVLPSE